jgi:hypothetical protein
MDLFPPSDEGRETPTLLVETTNIKHWTGRCLHLKIETCSYWNVVFPSYLGFWTTGKVQKASD